MFLSSYRKNNKKKKSLLRIHSSLSCTWSVLLHVLLAVNTRERAVVAHRWRTISFQESARSRGHVADAVPVLVEPTSWVSPKTCAQSRNWNIRMILSRALFLFSSIRTRPSVFAAVYHLRACNGATWLFFLPFWSVCTFLTTT